MGEVLSKSFYESEDVVQIAKDLLGHILVSNVGNMTTCGIIVETEAYKAPDDLASHAKHNRRTPRNEAMFSAPGHSYVYICYGIHSLFNVVTAPPNVPHAVLIRAVEPIDGNKVMIERRKFKKMTHETTNGPGKLTKAMAITKEHDGLLLYDHNSPIVIKKGKFLDFDIVKGPRVGMSHHTKESGHLPWRFRIKGNKWTSKPDKVIYNW